MAFHTVADHLPHIEPVGWLGITVSALIIAGYLIKVVRAMVRVTRRANEYFDAWNGEPARPGFPARPGIPERLAHVEDQSNRIERKLEAHIADTLESHA